MDFQGLQQSIS